AKGKRQKAKGKRLTAKAKEKSEGGGRNAPLFIFAFCLLPFAFCLHCRLHQFSGGGATWKRDIRRSAASLAACSSWSCPGYCSMRREVGRGMRTPPIEVVER